MHKCQRYIALFLLVAFSCLATNRYTWSEDDASVHPPIRQSQSLLWRFCCLLFFLRARWSLLISLFEEHISRGIGKHEIDSATKLPVAVLVFRVYARLLLLPFFHTLLSRTQVFAPRISIFGLPSIELCQSVTMERLAVTSNSPTQLAFIFFVLCFRVIELLRVMA